MPDKQLETLLDLYCTQTKIFMLLYRKIGVANGAVVQLVPNSGKALSHSPCLPPEQNPDSVILSTLRTMSLTRYGMPCI